ncbi:hypothetical protein CUS89_15950, partial [Enterococcus mundtii]
MNLLLLLLGFISLMLGLHLFSRSSKRGAKAWQRHLILFSALFGLILITGACGSGTNQASKADTATSETTSTSSEEKAKREADEKKELEEKKKEEKLAAEKKAQEEQAKLEAEKKAQEEQA